MRAGYSNWLLLSMLVLSALVFAEWRFQVGKGSGYQPVQSSTTPVEAMPVPVPRFALVDLESFSETLTRPLFMPDRRPPEEGSADSAVPEVRAASPKANRYALSAIIIVDNERIALLTDTATGDLNRVREGGSVAGWRVETIREDGAVLTNGDNREELTLRHFGPPKLRPKAPKRRTASKRKAVAQPAEKDVEAVQKRPRRVRRSARQTGRVPGTEAI